METGPKVCCNGKSPLFAFISGIIICAILAGGSFLIYQNMQENQALKSKISEIENRLNESDKEIVDLSVEALDVEEEIPVSIVKEPKYPADTFRFVEKQGFLGSMTLTGYTKISKELQSFCDPEQEECVYRDFVEFVVQKTYSDAINSFPDEERRKSFDIGCKENGLLKYFSVSDELGKGFFTLDDTSSKKLFNATESNPVTILITDLPSSMGDFGPPDCAVFFSKIEVY